MRRLVQNSPCRRPEKIETGSDFRYGVICDELMIDGIGETAANSETRANG